MPPTGGRRGKIDVNKACAALDDRVLPILDKLFNSQHNDDYSAFKRMNDKLQYLVTERHADKVDINHHNHERKGRERASPAGGKVRSEYE